MKVNFITDIKNDRGTLVFLCLKNRPFDKYLDNLNKKKVGRKKKDNSKNGYMFTNCRSCNTDLSGWRSNKDTRYCVDC